jgi:predicted nucleotidyltransferase
MRERPTIDVVAAPGGWPTPWPNVAELSDHLPTERWTLVGGLMVQLHAVHHRVGAIRPTNDVDIVLHVETSRGVPAAAADVLESLGYRLTTPVDPRNKTVHRFTRGDSRVDLLTSTKDTVDVLLADHTAPRVVEKLRGRAMVKIDGGTQALRRTINARLEIVAGQTTTISVPDEFGALILKAAAFQTDSRDTNRHLYDAAVLLCRIEDPYVERERFAGSDRKRLMLLANSLPADHSAWQRIPSEARAEGQAALRLLSAP